MNFSATILTDRECSSINECCGRLRLIQADAADVLPEKRVEFLNEEIIRCMKDVPVADRKRYLEALLSRFPVAGRILPTSNVHPEAEAPDQVIERFFAVAKTLSVETKQKLLKRLQSEGISPAENGAQALEIPEDLQQRLGLEASDPCDMKRVVELAACLVEE